MRRTNMEQVSWVLQLPVQGDRFLVLFFHLSFIALSSYSGLIGADFEAIVWIGSQAKWESIVDRPDMRCYLTLMGPGCCDCEPGESSDAALGSRPVQPVPVCWNSPTIKFQTLLLLRAPPPPSDARCSMKKMRFSPTLPASFLLPAG